MSKKRSFVAPLAATMAMVGLSLVTAAGPAGASASAGFEQVAGSAVPWVAHAHAVRDLPVGDRLSVEVWLKSDVAAASAYATAVSTPGSASYHRYLRPSAYAARFGPGVGQAHAVESWLRSEGFSGVTTDATRTYVRATGSVARIDAAFKVQMKVYSTTKGSGVNAGPYALQANDRAVSLPASLASTVLGVTGLDNAAPKMMLDHLRSSATGASSNCSTYYGEKTRSNLPEKFGTTTFPDVVCGYSGQQIRQAYGADSANTGRGETVALVEVGLAPYGYATLEDYAAANHLPKPSTTRYSELSLGQGSSCGDPFDEEEQLDVESSYAMAPGASQLVVGGDSCNFGDFGLQALFNADEAVIDGTNDYPLASIASNSWEGGTESQPTAYTNIEHSYLVQAAAEGVGMYFSSGDGSGVLAPSSDPYAVAVGGTTLGIGKGGSRLFETGWSTGTSEAFGGAWEFLGEQGAAGGGSSLLWKEPAYQKGVVPASLVDGPGNRGSSRSVPDLSADADPFTGFDVGLLVTSHHSIKYIETDIGGTSLASPLVAGMVAAAQQGQKTAFGFIDPAIYKLAGTSAFHDTLPVTTATPSAYRGVVCPAALCEAPSELLATFDNQTPHMGTSQVTLEGYDNMSGIGTPAGQSFISELRGL